MYIVISSIIVNVIIVTLTSVVVIVVYMLTLHRTPHCKMFTIVVDCVLLFPLFDKASTRGRVLTDAFGKH